MDSIIAASTSIKSSVRLKKILEVSERKYDADMASKCATVH